MRLRPANPTRRLAVCSLLVVMVFGALAFRVTQLQVLSGNRYKEMSLRQTLRTVSLPAQRGSIFDRNGSDLAMSIELTSIYADPRQVTDPITYAAELAPILNVSRQTLLARLSDKNFEFEYLARRVSDRVVDEVKKLELVGVGYVPESARRYPAGQLASSLIGMVGGEGYGLNGLERLYNSELAGKDGTLSVEQDQQGLDIPGTATHQVEARRGDDIELTLDESLQWEAEQSLIDEVTATRAQGGMAVVVDVTNGDVLALASVEGANDGQPARPSSAEELNRPLMEVFEPGSTNKLITLSTAIQDGVVGPNTVINVPSELRVGSATFTDVEAHGDVRMSVADILRESSNIGTIEIAQRLTKYQLANALRAFGLGEQTSVDFPGQASGLLLDPSKYYDTGQASTAIGYGVAVSGMQMLDAYATIANGGVTRPPQLLDATIDSKGIRHDAPEEKGHRVVSAQTAAEMRSLLTGVVTGGTGACAAIPGYRIAGKTGTSRKAVNGGYSSGTMASFIGFAPAEKPRLAAIVVLDQPSTEFGGAAAAPVFSDIMQFALTRDHVAPDDVADTQFDAARAAAVTSGTDCQTPAAALAAVQSAPPPTTTTTTTVGPSSTAATHDAGKAGRAKTGTNGAATSTTSTTPTTVPGSLGHDTSPSG